VDLTQAKDVTAISTDERLESLRVEYRAANDYAIHLSELNWQVGSILVGGSLAAVAVSLTTKRPMAQILITSASLIAVIAWLLFLWRNHSYSRITTKRMVSIERELGSAWGFRGQIDYGSNPHREIIPEQLRVSGPSATSTALFLGIALIAVELLLIISLFAQLLK
jgi:hypothetical protein